MTWVKIDENFAQHPKVVKAGPLAIAMQVAALCYCNRNLTDGFIPRSVARTLLDWEVVDGEGQVHTLARTSGISGNDVTSEWVIGLLVDAGLWTVEGHGYRIHDYLEYQPSAENVRQQREKTKSRVSQWRKRNHDAGNTGGNDERNDVGSDAGNSVTNASVTSAPYPVSDSVSLKKRESAPQADAPDPLELPASLDRRGKRLDWEYLPDEARAFCRDERPDIDPDRLFAGFRDFWIGKPGAGGRKLDWLATWRNWVRKEKPHGNGKIVHGSDADTARRRAGLTEGVLDLMGAGARGDGPEGPDPGGAGGRGPATPADRH